MLDLFRKARTVRAYRQLFLTSSGALKPEAQEVLLDLYDFARFHKNVPPDPLALAVAEGGRQVVRHINKRLNTTADQLRRQIKQQAEGVYDE